MMHSPVDSEKLYEIMGSDEELIQECFNDFITDYHSIIEEIKTAVEAHDFNALNNAAHKLKGALSYLAAKPAFNAAQELEQAGKNEQNDKLLEKLTNLEGMCGQLMEFIHNFKPTTPPPH